MAAPSTADLQEWGSPRAATAARQELLGLVGGALPGDAGARGRWAALCLRRDARALLDSRPPHGLRDRDVPEGFEGFRIFDAAVQEALKRAEDRAAQRAAGLPLNAMFGPWEGGMPASQCPAPPPPESTVVTGIVAALNVAGAFRMGAGMETDSGRIAAVTAGLHEERAESLLRLVRNGKGEAEAAGPGRLALELTLPAGPVDGVFSRASPLSSPKSPCSSEGHGSPGSPWPPPDDARPHGASAARALRTVIGLLGLDVHEAERARAAEKWLRAVGPGGPLHAGVDGAEPQVVAAGDDGGHEMRWQLSVLSHLRRHQTVAEVGGPPGDHSPDFQEHLGVAELLLRRICHAVGVLRRGALAAEVTKCRKTLAHVQSLFAQAQRAASEGASRDSVGAQLLVSLERQLAAPPAAPAAAQTPAAAAPSAQRVGIQQISRPLATAHMSWKPGQLAHTVQYDAISQLTQAQGPTHFTDHLLAVDLLRIYQIEGPTRGERRARSTSGVLSAAPVVGHIQLRAASPGIYMLWRWQSATLPSDLIEGRGIRIAGVA
ncbi:unnamed protein product [Prorocentrum cordatum]|uniref:Uncharacterized protein n=1 Tax=Prorocentrum cordatum TaxID=2364126 RepID=A0ABN9THF6_9DINO|nr:unnamed protein product [Polarella glacialis]